MTDKKDKVSTQVNLPRDIKKAAQIWAKQNDMTMTQMIIVSLKQMMQEPIK